MICLCGENVQSHPWTNPDIIQKTYSLLGLIKLKLNKPSISSILMEDGEVLKHCLKFLHEKLRNDQWKFYPGAQQCFAWILRQVSCPILSQYLCEFMPFILRFLDDWQFEKKIFALHCIDHLIDNVSKADLEKYGYVQVLQDALFHAQVHHHLDLLSILFPLTFKYLEKIHGKKANFAKFDAWDDLTKKLLYTMETESKLDLKRFYGHQLSHALLPALGLGSVRWLSSILSVISNYAELIDVECRLAGLECLSIILNVCEQRVRFHAEIIYEILIRLLYNAKVRT